MTMPKDKADGIALADPLTIRHQAFIDGRYVDAASGKAFDWSAGAIDKIYGETAPAGDEVVATVAREPIDRRTP